MIEQIKKLKVGKVIEKPLLKNYTTYKVGGPAQAIVYPLDVDKLVILLKYLKDNDIPFKILGNGSNLIFQDEGYNGILIKLDKLDTLKVNGTTVTVGAGYSLVKLSLKVAKLGLTGLEFASGIPGTVGGAIYMNAGAYKSDMGYVARSIKVLTPNLEIKTMYNKDLDFHYRSSFLQKNKGYICLEVTLGLRKGKTEAIMQVINERRTRRLESQPLEYPSAGSVFRNPEGDYAGRLIEELGYKGKGKHDAIVSEKHANFIINKGDAKAQDVIALIREIQSKVKETYDIDLILEQEIVDKG